jgi:hypothetical protein
VDALIETHIERGGVDKGNAGAATQATGSEEDDQWNQGGRGVFDKAGITDQARELGPPGFHNLLTVVGFEVALMGLMESDQDGHNFAHRQGTGALALLLATGHQLAVPGGQKSLAEIIEIAEQLK